MLATAVGSVRPHLAAACRIELRWGRLVDIGPAEQERWPPRRGAGRCAVTGARGRDPDWASDADRREPEAHRDAAVHRAADRLGRGEAGGSGRSTAVGSNRGHAPRAAVDLWCG